VKGEGKKGFLRNKEGGGLPQQRGNKVQRGAEFFRTGICRQTNKGSGRVAFLRGECTGEKREGQKEQSCLLGGEYGKIETETEGERG